jgi:preprotein translocase subunit SecB
MRKLRSHKIISYPGVQYQIELWVRAIVHRQKQSAIIVQVNPLTVLNSMKSPAKMFKHPLNILIIGLSASLIFPASVKALSNLVPDAAIPQKPVILLAQSTQQIQFRKNAHSTQIKGSVARGNVNNYLIRAKKGQAMNLKIQSVEKNAVFNLIDSNRRTIVKGVKSWSGVVPKTGDYKIAVGTERGGASYTLSVSIN